MQQEHISCFKLKRPVGQGTSRLWAVLRGHCPIVQPQEPARGLNEVRLLVVAYITDSLAVQIVEASLLGHIPINFSIEP
jgi:hypothetical protein